MGPSLYPFAPRPRARLRFGRARLHVEELEPRIALAVAAAPASQPSNPGTSGPSAQAPASPGTSASPGATPAGPASGPTFAAATQTPAPGGTPTQPTAALPQRAPGQGFPGPVPTAAAQPVAASNLTPYSASVASWTQLVNGPLPPGVTPFDLQRILPGGLLRSLPLYEQPALNVVQLGINLTPEPGQPAARIPTSAPLAAAPRPAEADAGPGPAVVLAADVGAGDLDLVFAPAAAPLEEGASLQAPPEALDAYFAGKDGPAADLPLLPPKEALLPSPALLVAGWAFLEEARRGRADRERRAAAS